jgi:hypothetical protein
MPGDKMTARKTSVRGMLGDEIIQHIKSLKLKCHLIGAKFIIPSLKA